MNDTETTRPLNVELPLEEYELVRRNAEAEHRTLKGEVRRIIKLAYGLPDIASSETAIQPTPATAGGV